MMKFTYADPVLAPRCQCDLCQQTAERTEDKQILFAGRLLCEGWSAYGQIEGDAVLWHCPPCTDARLNGRM